MKLSIFKKKYFPELEELYKNFEICEDGNLCIAIGGDGTFLEAARRTNIPILHIRSNDKDSLGFHADVSINEINLVIDELQKGNYSIDEYSKICLDFKGSIIDVINDIVVFRASTKNIHLKIYRQNNFLELLYPRSLKGDGIIVSTQIGSTGYNLSAHGPIIYKTQAVAITPILCNLNYSIVSNGSFLLELEKNDASIQCDGIEIGKIKKGESANIYTSNKTLKIIRLTKKEKFNEKLKRLFNF